ncbi:MAG: putative aminohydrolase SsnA [Deltaproteobacteria bacterium]|nr:putative aminohydrolase SsnA [Deltaproteobacteria bacterium]
MSILIKNGTVITLGKENRVLKNHSVLIEGSRISKIGPSKSFNGKFKTVIDAENKVVMPGFINNHMHFYSTMVRGLGKARPSKDFTEVLKNLWWRLDKKLTLQDVYYSALIMMINAIKHGTTTLIDHHASPFAIRGSLFEIAKASAVVGLRVSCCYEVSDRDGKKIRDEGMSENKEFIEWSNKENSEFVKAMFGLHASFTVSDDTLKISSEIGNGLGAGFHIHCAEALSDEDHAEKSFGMRVVERLSRFGIVNYKSVLAHCVHINWKEMDIISKNRAFVAHNPQSNLNNAVGIADVVGMNKRGIKVLLGTDAMTVNMLEELRVALWAQHLKQDNPSAGFVEIASTLLYNNPEFASNHFGIRLGEISEGAAADIILIDYIPPTQFDESTVLGHIIYGISQEVVDTTIVGGRILMKDKKLKIDVDEEEVCKKSRELAKKLWDRF